MVEEGRGGRGCTRAKRDHQMRRCVMCVICVRICGCKSATFGGGPHLEKNLLKLMRSHAITMFVF